MYSVSKIMHAFHALFYFDVAQELIVSTMPLRWSKNAGKAILNSMGYFIGTGVSHTSTPTPLKQQWSRCVIELYGFTTKYHKRNKPVYTFDMVYCAFAWADSSVLEINVQPNATIRAKSRISTSNIFISTKTLTPRYLLFMWMVQCHSNSFAIHVCYLTTYFYPFYVSLLESRVPHAKALISQTTTKGRVISWIL